MKMLSLFQKGWWGCFRLLGTIVFVPFLAVLGAFAILLMLWAVPEEEDVPPEFSRYY